jgi:hypothetical protein
MNFGFLREFFIENIRLHELASADIASVIFMT